MKIILTVFKRILKILLFPFFITLLGFLQAFYAFLIFPLYYIASGEGFWSFLESDTPGVKFINKLVDDLYGGNYFKI